MKSVKVISFDGIEKFIRDSQYGGIRVRCIPKEREISWRGVNMRRQSIRLFRIDVDGLSRFYVYREYILKDRNHIFVGSEVELI